MPTLPCVSCSRNLSATTPSVLWFVLLTRRVDKVAYPHFNVYPAWVRVLVPLTQDAPRLKEPRKSHKELHDEVAPHLPTTIPDVPRNSKAMGRRPRGLTIVARRQEPGEMPALPSIPKVSPLRRRVSSPYWPSGQNPSPIRRRVSPVFDGFPSIEARLSQSEDEAAEPSNGVTVTLTRSKSHPTTPKRRQSALITEKIKALSAAAEPPEPVFDRPVRRSIRPLPVSPTRA